MTGSIFSPEQFLQSTYTNKTDTRLIPVPQGEYNAQIEKVAARRQEKDGDVFYVLDVFWAIMDDGAKAATGLEKPVVKQSIFLDVTSEGSIDMGRGKSVQLGRLREAVQQNSDGQPWSPIRLTGAIARVAVSHRLDKGETYADVKRVTTLS